MGYLQDKLRETQQLLDFYKYELSEEVVNRKLDLQKWIGEQLENDKYEGVLDIADECITLETELYDDVTSTTSTFFVNIVKVVSNDGEVYVEDRDGNEYFIDDIDERTFNEIYDAVISLT